MINKRFSKKLVLNKTTIARLGHFHMKGLYGRNADGDECMTEPEPSCIWKTINQPDCITIWPICDETKPGDCPGKPTMSIHPCIC